jgi:hypothetical protein
MFDILQNSGVIVWLKGNPNAIFDAIDVYGDLSNCGFTVDTTNIVAGDLLDVSSDLSNCGFPSQATGNTITGEFLDIFANLEQAGNLFITENNNG